MSERIYPKRIAVDTSNPWSGMSTPILSAEHPADFGYRRLPGYHIVPTPGKHYLGHNLETGVRERWAFYNRSFDEIDAILNNDISSKIKEFLDSLQHPIRILDLGGGILSVAARDLARRFGSSVNVTNLDVILKDDIPDTENFRAVLGDAANMPFPDDSFNIIYSFQVLHYLNRERRHLAHDEIDRVLAPNGAAFIDGGLHHQGNPWYGIELPDAS